MSKQISMVVRHYSDCDDPIARFVNKPKQEQKLASFLRVHKPEKPALETTNQTVDRARFLVLWRLKQIVYVLVMAGLSHLPVTITLTCALPIVVVGLLSTGETKAQTFLRPIGNINMFKSHDTTINAQAYNKLTTREQRDSIIDVRLKEDFTNTIGGRIQPTVWSCNQSTLQLIANSHDWGKKDTYISNHLFYNGYDGNDLEQIYQNQGTTKDMGKLGLPTYEVDLNDDITLPDGHGMNAILTGDTLTNFNNWNLIEPQTDATNVKPKEQYIPENCKHVQILYNYLFKNDTHEKNFWQIKVLEFEIIDGKATLTYNINNDNNLVYNADNLDNDPRLYVPLNERVHVFETRQEAITSNKTLTLENIAKVYPNPANNYINIEIPNNNHNQINTEIYTIEGKLLKTEQKDNGEEIDVSNLKEGMYLVRTTAGNTKYNGKFVKR